LGVELLGADAPVSFTDVPLSFDWARDMVVGEIITTNPPRIRAPQTVGTFMIAPNGQRVATTGLQIEIA
jgi:hypothetical protein